jgi:predicted nuclease with TOPRIM domain
MADEENAATEETSAEDKGSEGNQEEKDFREFAGVEHDTPSDPAWDNKRFRQIYRRYKDGERLTAEMRADMKTMADHNQKLASAVEKITSATGEIVQTQVQKQAKESESEIEKMEVSIAELKVKRKNARVEANWDEVDKADEQIQKLEKKLDKRKDEIAENAKKETKLNPVAERADTVAIRDFVQATPWYNMESDDFDPVMVSAAKEYDTALMNKPKYKGKVELTGDRLKEVAVYIEKRFAWKKEKPSENKQSKVEGVGNEHETESKGKGVTALTADQKRTAHRMLDESVGAAKAETEYLKQLKMIDEGA